MDPIWRGINYPRQNIGSTEARQGSKNRPAAPKVSRAGPKGASHGRRECQDRAKMAKLEPRCHHGPKMAKDASTWAQRQVKMTQERAKIGPTWPSWSQDGVPMAPRWPKMRQQGPRRPPRSSQDSQVGGKMATTWPQDAKDVQAWADTCAYLEKPSFS